MWPGNPPLSIVPKAKDTALRAPNPLRGQTLSGALTEVKRGGAPVIKAVGGYVYGLRGETVPWVWASPPNSELSILNTELLKFQSHLQSSGLKTTKQSCSLS